MGLKGLEEEEEEEKGGMCGPLGSGSCGQGGGNEAGARLRAKLSLPQPFLGSSALALPAQLEKKAPPAAHPWHLLPIPPVPTSLMLPTQRCPKGSRSTFASAH